MTDRQGHPKILTAANTRTQVQHFVTLPPTYATELFQIFILFLTDFGLVSKAVVMVSGAGTEMKAAFSPGDGVTTWG